MNEIERKNPDGSLTIGCLEDTIKAPKKETKPAPKFPPKKGKKSKEIEEIIIDDDEIIVDEDGVVIE